MNILRSVASKACTCIACEQSLRGRKGENEIGFLLSSPVETARRLAHVWRHAQESWVVRAYSIIRVNSASAKAYSLVQSLADGALYSPPCTKLNHIHETWNQRKNTKPKNVKQKNTKLKNTKPKNTKSKNVKPRNVKPKNVKLKNAKPKNTKPKIAKSKNVKPKSRF